MNTNDKIGVCSRSFSRNPLLRSELLSKFSNVKFNDEGLSLNGDTLVEFLSDCDGAVIALEYINNDILDRLPKLKFIGKYGVGLDKLDFDALDKHQVKLGWTPGVNATSVAELTLNMALTIVRNTTESNQRAEKMQWKQVTGKQLSSLTFGIVGFGHVGSKVGRLAKAFGCDVKVFDKVDKSAECAEVGVDFVGFNELLQQADIISVHVPGNAETHHMLGAAQFAQMKTGSYLINSARGGIVDEAALLAALNSDKMAAAGVDVLEIEPPTDLDFIAHPKTFVTTHIGGSSEEAIVAMGFAAIEGLSNYTVASEFEIYK
ncbi:MAG: phosphoglycerate dehydrogenase-like enzyme [Phenylobacterium sp.]|jgi:phosphoglycerate dehydrogenase-like enzyme